MSRGIVNSSIGTLGARTEWLLWFIAMTACVVLVGLRYLGNALPSTSADAMSMLILGLFAVVVVKSFRDASFLDRETRLATRQVEQLVEINDVARFLEVAAPSVFRSHIGALHTIFLRDSTIHQDNLVEVVLARLHARNRVVELLASVLITLGLIGTILGLLLSVGGLGRVLQGGTDFEEVRGAMQETVSGLGTAFYTTLFGAVTGGVILRILTSVIEAHIVRFVAHMSELAEVHVLPAMRRTAAVLAGQGFYESHHGDAGASQPGTAP